MKYKGYTIMPHAAQMELLRSIGRDKYEIRENGHFVDYASSVKQAKRIIDTYPTTQQQEGKAGDE